jgi:hypothetical protein
MKLTKADRTLLELAAKAAGFLVNPAKYSDGLFVVHPDANDQDHQQFWNPLELNDDAFELAVIMDINISFVPTFITTGQDENVGTVEIINHATDKFKAARRAVVRAAAAVGEQMP